MNMVLKKKISKSFYPQVIKLLLLLLIMITTINAKEKYTNSLISEDSPYLQQHAHNPVNWYAWNKESFKKAKDENKMIFLSIGYSTCHWCHVMEEESFENEEVAKILNKDYISIKVDREEMPHIDKYYQNVYNIIKHRGGGWPLTIVLTPNRKAFFAETYIPIETRYNRLGIKELLTSIQRTFKNDLEKINKTAEQIEEILNDYKSTSTKNSFLSIKLVSAFVDDIDKSFDHENFGIGVRPKFPHASSIETLLDIYTIFKNDKALNLAEKMLKAMASGGIYDQIEGGFYRYSVDEKWMIPHFEKMLYTNAELLSAYSKAYSITNNDFYKNIVNGIIDFTKIRFEKENLLYSASDADSLIKNKKEEGAYFVFSYNETKSFLKEKGYTKDEIEKIVNYFNISFEGNFENGLSNPYLKDTSSLNNISKIKTDLKELREKKSYPFVDYKILTSWNAMYISSLFEASILDSINGKNAIKLLDTLLENLYINNILYHQRLLDKKPKVRALFEDYSFLINTLLKAYDFSLEKKYLTLAITLNNEAINKFYKNNNWLMSDDEFKSNAEVYDSSYRSSLSQMIDNILKIALLDEDLKLQNLVKNSLENNSFILASSPSSSSWLVRTYMAFKKEYIVLKAPKDSLENKTLIRYPFLLKKVNKNKLYLACKVDVCFAYNENFKKIISEIEKEISK